jgi:nucleoside phosphorylase
MYDVVVFTALGWERRALCAGVAGLRPGNHARTWSARLGDDGTCLLVQTGMGCQRAARAARDAPPSRLFVTCGCGGALAPDLRPGDVVAADAVVGLDDALQPGERFPVAQTAAWVASHRMPVRVGRIASSPRVLTTPGDKERAARAGGIVVDMESVAVSTEAMRRGIPHVVVRVVLDVATQRLRLPLGGVDAETGELRVGPTLRAVAPPWRWPEALRLGRQRAMAARRLRELGRLLLGAGGLAAFAPPARSDDVGDAG